MGKRGQQSWEDTARYASWAASSQSSAWSGWPAKGKGKQWAEWKDDYHYRAKDSRDFPSYAAMPILGKEGGVPHSAVEPGSEQKLHPGASLAREVQRLVNGVRKSETRYRKAEEELAAEKARWHKFMDKMKKNFIQERSKYRASLGKLEKEMTDQQVAQEAAVQDLQKFLLQPVASPQADAATEEANAEWEELMKATPEEDSGLSGQLAEALGGRGALPPQCRAQMLGILAAHASSTRLDAAVTPPRRTSRLPPSTPPAVNPSTRVAKDTHRAAPLPMQGASPPPAVSDPYVTSHRLAVSVIAPSQIPPALNLPQDPGQDGRQSSLDAKLGSTSLADKLEQRRAMAVDITSDDEEEDLLADLGERGRAE